MSVSVTLILIIFVRPRKSEINDLASIFMTFKKTESKTKNDTKWIATNIRILQHPVSVFLASTKKCLTRQL